MLFFFSTLRIFSLSKKIKLSFILKVVSISDLKSYFSQEILFNVCVKSSQMS